MNNAAALGSSQSSDVPAPFSACAKKTKKTKKSSVDAEFVMETILLGFRLLFSLFRLNVPFAFTLCPVYVHCSLK